MDILPSVRTSTETPAMRQVTEKINNAGGVFNPGTRNTVLECEQTETGSANLRTKPEFK